MFAIKTADLTQNFKTIADRIIRGDRVLISRPKNENLVMITEQEYNELEKLRVKANKGTLAEAFRDLQDESVANGMDKMTMEEIDAEIATYRQEKRGTK